MPGYGGLLPETCDQLQGRKGVGRVEREEKGKGREGLEERNRRGEGEWVKEEESKGEGGRRGKQGEGA